MLNDDIWVKAKYEKKWFFSKPLGSTKYAIRFTRVQADLLRACMTEHNNGSLVIRYFKYTYFIGLKLD